MGNAWSDSTGLAINSDIRTQAKSRLAAAADWAGRNQVRQYWPAWNANTGRLPYHVHLPTDALIYSTAWNTARAAQGLLSAWRVLHRTADLATVERSVEYVKALQCFAPECPDVAGLFGEETPVSDHFSMRDSIECGQLLLAHYAVTQTDVSLLRAKKFCSCFVNLMETERWPGETWFLIPRLEAARFMQAAPPAGRVQDVWNNFVGALPLAQMYALTGDRRCLECAERLGALILQHTVRSDGAFISPRADPIHASGADGVLDNDDGLCVALVALWKQTGKTAYLDAAVANGDWWIRKGPDLPVTYATLPTVLIIMADLARATNERRFIEYIEAMAARFFALQIVRDERLLVQGAFRGEDMAEHYRKGSCPADFISLRSTSYGLLALGKLGAGGQGEWNPAYSGFGL